MRRLTDLVEILLEVTRAEGDPSERNTDDVALEALLRDIVEDCGMEAGVRGCRLVLKGAGQSHLCGDRELLRRAIENIVRNAIRHAPEGSAIDITLNGSPSNSSLAIRDYGPGVPAEALTSIFKPFFRLDHARDTASGGVGLVGAGDCAESHRIARRQRMGRKRRTRPAGVCEFAGSGCCGLRTCVVNWSKSQL